MDHQVEKQLFTWTVALCELLLKKKVKNDSDDEGS